MRHRKQLSVQVLLKDGSLVLREHFMAIMKTVDAMKKNPFDEELLRTLHVVDCEFSAIEKLEQKIRLRQLNWLNDGNNETVIKDSVKRIVKNLFTVKGLQLAWQDPAPYMALLDGNRILEQDAVELFNIFTAMQKDPLDAETLKRLKRGYPLNQDGILLLIDLNLMDEQMKLRSEVRDFILVNITAGAEGIVVWKAKKI